MPQRPISPELLQEAVDLHTLHGGSPKAALHATNSSGGKGVPIGTFKSRHRSAVLAGYKPRVEAPPKPEKPEEPKLRPDERQRLMDKLSNIQRELKEANRRLNMAEDLRRGLYGLIDQPLEPIKILADVGKGSNPLEIPVLFASDFQWGEVIKSEELDGLNSFDREIASKRYTRLVETFMDLAIKSNNGRKPPYAIYLRGGDMISGEIHEDLYKSNDLLSLPALRDLAMHEAGGIEVMAEELGCPIHVVSVPGNHDRTTRKPQSKMYVATSYAEQLAWFLEMYFTAKGDKRVTFQTPRSGDALFQAFNTRFLLTHGDRIGSRGGEGFIGPAATIARGMKKVVDMYAATGTFFDHILVGHFHTSLKLEYGWSNGSLPGYSEFARDLRCRPKPPTQWYFSVHPTRGVVEEREIMVGGLGEGKLIDQALLGRQ